MKNIYDYLNENYNKPFKKVKFNEADALVFTALSYLDLGHFLKDNKPHKFKEVINLENVNLLVHNTISPLEDRKLVHVLEKVTRYDEMIFDGYSSFDSVDECTQFFAFNLRLKYYGNYIVFRGTNLSMHGIIEDLKFGIDKPLKSTLLGEKFVTKVLSKSKLKGMLIGHSKGGTVAELVFNALNREIKNKVTKVLNFDGPGVINPPPRNEKINKYITKRTIFGLLLKTNNDYKVADGDNFYLLNHIPYSWHIEKRKIVTIPSPIPRSFERGKNLENFINEVGVDQIERIVNETIEIMKKGEVRSIEQFTLKHVNEFFTQIIETINDSVYVKFILTLKDVFL